MKERRISQRISKFNRKRIITELLKTPHSPLSRSHLSRVLDVSFPSVSYIVSKLKDDGLVVEREKGILESKASAGRKPVPIMLDPSYGITISVQIGYENAKVNVVEVTGEVVAGSFLTFPRKVKFKDLFNKISKKVLNMLEDFKEYKHVLSAVISVPAPIDYKSQRIVKSRFYGWEDEELPRYLRWGEEKIGLIWENDANLLAYGASRFLGIRNLLGFYLGFGIGAGIVIEGKVYRGFNGMAGEIGQLVLMKEGSKYQFEEYATERAFIEMKMEVERNGKDTEMEMPAFLEKLERRASEDKLRKRMEEVALEIAQHLAPVVMALDPQLVVFGGEVVRYFPSFMKILRKKLAETSEKSKGNFRFTRKGEDFISYGAHWLSAIHWFGLEDVENLERGWKA